uniref:Uncharacterized protein n=1 Tax=Physcomitrium patens TaxID=3218 RepID=A0A2K1JSV8_PHYPA|nr:hypothetical protein PHYPA_014388 [Physcomitrium patens]
MCNVEGYESLSFKPKIDNRIVKVKLYQELCHVILAVIQKQCLDDMPRTIRTMHIKLNQMQDLLARRPIVVHIGKRMECMKIMLEELATSFKNIV